MKTKSVFILFILFILSSTQSVNAQVSNFSGEWKLNKVKTVLAENQLFLTRVSVQIKGDSLLTNRVYENPNGEEYPFQENLSLDGKDCKIVVYEMPRVSKASKTVSDGQIVVESKTTFNGSNGEDSLASKETWKVDTTGKILTIEFVNKMSGGESTGTNIYDKVK